MELNNDILKQSMPIFDFNNPPIDPIELSKMLADEMLAHKGIGLSANQLGLPYRAFAIGTSPIYVMFNAKIVWQSEETHLAQEGCLSFPGLIVKVKRATSIKVRFTMPNGVTKTEAFDGIYARIIQHEIDHMNGVLFYDRATRFHKEQAFRQWKRNKK